MGCIFPNYRPLMRPDTETRTSPGLQSPASIRTYDTYELYYRNDLLSSALALSLALLLLHFSDGA